MPKTYPLEKGDMLNALSAYVLKKDKVNKQIFPCHSVRILACGFTKEVPFGMTKLLEAKSDKCEEVKRIIE